MSKKFVKVPVETLTKLTLLCDVCEFSNNESVAKIAREVRPNIEGLEYV